MAKYFYHPYGENAPNASPYTRSGHGCGKLDINGNHTPFYAMCDGKIVGVGTWSDGNFYCVQECNNSALGLTFYIRYLHGDYVVNTGDYVNAGDLLGYTTTNNGMYNDHLHIDFSWVSNDFDPVAGSFNSEKTIYTVKNKKMKIKSGIINWNKLDEWKNTNGGSAYGYCWLVFAQTPKYLEKQTGSNIEITEELITQIKQKLLQYEGQHWSDAQVKAIINCYNAVINTGLVNRNAAIAIVANGMQENLSGCTGNYSHPDYADWGFGNDGRNPGTDCGIWAFHSGGNAFNDKVIPNIKPYILSCGFSESEFNKGNYDVQGQYIAGICANKNSKYKLSIHSNGKAITSPKTGQTICATSSLQQKYVNNFNQYFEEGNDIGQGALLFERLFENSAQDTTSLKRRAGAAYALDECFKTVEITKLNIASINQNTIGLPTGCEVTSLGIALNYKNKNNGMTLKNLILKLAGSNYLPQANKSGNTGPDPLVTFVGSPSSSSSYGCFSNCIADTIRNYNTRDSAGVTFGNTTGQSLNTVLKNINKNRPVLAWITSNDLHPIEYVDSWTIQDSRSDRNGQTYTWPRYEHCVVIIGYDDATIYTADPLSSTGYKNYERSAFEQRFNQMGKYSLVIT